MLTHVSKDDNQVRSKVKSHNTRILPAKRASDISGVGDLLPVLSGDPVLPLESESVGEGVLDCAKSEMNDSDSRR